jgi:hypothetical protein
VEKALKYFNGEDWSAADGSLSWYMLQGVREVQAVVQYGKAGQIF